MTRLCTKELLLVCRGIARKLGLWVTGRRNAIGRIVGRRRCDWQSGTTPSFGVLFRSNSHTAPNYRLPVFKETHDDDACRSEACRPTLAEAENTKVISIVAQRAQREATGYYCGYTFTAQPVGRRYHKAAAENLNYLKTGMADKSAAQQWHRITHRVLTDFQHR